MSTMSSGDSIAVSTQRRHRRALSGAGEAARSPGLPVGVEHHVQARGEAAGRARCRRGCATRRPSRAAPSRTPFQSEPSARRSSSFRLSPPPGSSPTPVAGGDQHPHEPMEVAVPLEEPPVEPADLVVLAVRVVVASLRPAHLVAHQTASASPRAISEMQKFFTCRRRSRSTSGSSVGPSTPQFQDRFSSVPSRSPSPFASLCLPSYVTRSFRVKPSWQVTKLMLRSGPRSSCPKMSGLPKHRCAKARTVSLSAS